MVYKTQNIRKIPVKFKYKTYRIFQRAFYHPRSNAGNINSYKIYNFINSQRLILMPITKNL